ncbi:hypothetical protein [Haliangium sp.]|uniref:hypothetical protein n=1 Tax=Haliangium sp. TaxID=2663208 RepID=UPI003D0C0EC3
MGSSTQTARRLIANLDCEAAFAEYAGVSRYHLTRPVARRISALGTLLSVFGRAGDALWTPQPVASERCPRAGGVVLESGPLSERPAAAVLAWGETAEVASLRARGVGSPAVPGADWPTRLWSLHADPGAVVRGNDRRFCFTLQARYGYLLPDAAILDSLPAVRAHLADCAIGAEQSWVLEAPFAASGRLRVRRRGRALDRAIEVRIERLLARFGSLCFAPWVERGVDLGCLGVIDGSDHWQVFEPHRLDVDHAGVFRGVDLTPGEWLSDAHRAAVREAAERAAEALAGIGYRGPFGIDGFTYRCPRQGGASRLQPMCEINARLSFGFVAHAWAWRRGAHALRLRVGTGAPKLERGATGAGDLLLAPGGDDDCAAWLELDRA